MEGRAHRQWPTGSDEAGLPLKAQSPFEELLGVRTHFLILSQPPKHRPPLQRLLSMY